MKDVFISRAEEAIFGAGTFACMIKHNEDGAELLFEVPCGLVPVACFTNPENSLSSMLVLAIRDLTEEVRAGGVYTIEIDHVEGREPGGLCEHINLDNANVKVRESYDDTEWMDGMVSRHLCLKS